MAPGALGFVCTDRVVAGDRRPEADIHLTGVTDSFRLVSAGRDQRSNDCGRRDRKLAAPGGEGRSHNMETPWAGCLEEMSDVTKHGTNPRTPVSTYL